MLVNCSCTSLILSLSSRNGPFQNWSSQSSFSVDLPWTACGFVCNVRISMIRFSSVNIMKWLNSNGNKPSKVIPFDGPWYDRIASNNANSFLQVRNALWVFQGERRRGTKSIRLRLRATETHMKPFVRTSFLGTRPSCLASPGRPFFAADDRKPILWLGAQAAQ